MLVEPRGTTKGGSELRVTDRDPHTVEFGPRRLTEMRRLHSTIWARVKSLGGPK